MIGTTGLKGLRIDCVVGIHAHERGEPQPLLLDIELDHDFRAAAESDQIGGAVDYEAVVRDVKELATRRRFQLIETMAEETAALLLARHAPVIVVRIEIRKPDAVAEAECSFVRVARSR